MLHSLSKLADLFVCFHGQQPFSNQQMGEGEGGDDLRNDFMINLRAGINLVTPGSADSIKYQVALPVTAR